MPTHVQSYYPLPNGDSGNTFRMNLESENGVFQLRFQELSREWNDKQCQVMLPRAQVAMVGSMARTVPVRTNRFVWQTQASPILLSHRIILTSRGGGFFIHDITRNTVNVTNIRVNAVESTYCAPGQIRNNPRVVVANWQNSSLSMGEFLREMHHVRMAMSTQFVSTMAIVVAVGTGVVMSLGFGPAAGMSGLGSSLSGSTTATAVTGTVVRDRIAHAVATGMANGITTFLRGSLDEMTRIARSSDRADSRRNAARFWRNNHQAMQRIIGLSMSSAVFNAATSYIPGGSINSTAEMTMGTLVRMITDRLANNLTGVIQSILEDLAQGRDVDWDGLRNSTILGFTIRGIS